MHRFWGLLFGVMLLGMFALTAVAPLCGWWLPMSASSYAPDIDHLFYLILFVVAFFYVLTEALLVYNIFRSGAPGRKSQFTHGSQKLEIIWSVIPGIILIAIAVLQIQAWADIKYPTHLEDRIAKGERFLQIGVEARQWEYRLRYPSVRRFEGWKSEAKSAKDDFVARLPERRDDIHLMNDIHVWKDQNVVLYLKTRDVGHSVFFPNLRLKQDALPGKTIPVWFRATVANTKKVGDKWQIGIGEGKTEYEREFDFDVVCTQYCGTRHSMMRGKLYVHPDENDYLDWLRHAASLSNMVNGDPAAVAATP